MSTSNNVINIDGNRQNSTGSGTLVHGTGQNLTPNTSFIMPRAGSIVGLGASVLCSAQTTPGDITINVLVNNVYKYNITLSINGIGTYSGVVTQAEGIDTLVANDVIALTSTFVTFVGTLSKTFANIEIAVNN